MQSSFVFRGRIVHDEKATSPSVNRCENADPRRTTRTSRRPDSKNWWSAFANSKESETKISNICTDIHEALIRPFCARRVKTPKIRPFFVYQRESRQMFSVSTRFVYWCAGFRGFLKCDTCRNAAAMNKDQMVSFRLDTASLRKLNILRRCRHRSRGQILREAIDVYFQAYNPVLPSTEAEKNLG